MMIGAPDVEQVLEAALQLVEHVSQVGREVGFRAVLAHDHPILLVAELGAPEPPGAVLLISASGRFQSLDRALDGAAVDQAALREPVVEQHAEFGQVLANVGENSLHRQVEDAPIGRGADQFARPRDDGVDVRVLVAALRFVGGQIREHGRRGMPQAVAFHADAFDVRAVVQHLLLVARAQLPRDLPVRR